MQPATSNLQRRAHIVWNSLMPECGAVSINIHRAHNLLDTFEQGLLSFVDMSLALENVARLKPNLRLAMAVSEYSASLDEPQRVEFKTLQTLSPPLTRDILQLTEELNRDGGRRSHAWKPWATRLVPALDMVQSFTKIGDLLMTGSQNMIASVVWASMKLTLQVRGLLGSTAEENKNG
jgi:hypothetical protein